MAVLLQVIVPIFAIIGCGWVADRLSLIPGEGVVSLNHFVYYFALPALLFSSLSTAPVSQLINENFILATLFTILTGFIITVFLFTYIWKHHFPELSLYGMIATYGNTGFIGIPLLTAIFGEDGTVAAALATFLYDVILITLVVMSFETEKVVNNKHRNQKNILPVTGMIGSSVLLNPINASLLLGIVVAIMHVPIPSFVSVFTDTLGQAAAPAALFTIGLGLGGQNSLFKSKTHHVSEFLTLLSLKLVVLPLIAFLFAFVIFPFDNETWAMSVVILSALPTGAVVYVFAEKYQTLVKEVPLYTLAITVVSMLTISLILLIMVGNGH
ncbi:AEC family transporter [Alteribacillus iranensis]|uniref:Transporter n=1 Tax=Alteribacillus iranensis TaxID=930128 RepID=A0A1I2F4U2_9BACI|nr:AEC family transporter [Alteribacillus iranensis]SFE99540.1 hypothetical protein SAMN05192532_10875 [Alteribacillus iranensis]